MPIKLINFNNYALSTMKKEKLTLTLVPLSDHFAFVPIPYALLDL